MALSPGTIHALPYHSYVEVSASVTTEAGPFVAYSGSESGSGTSSLAVDSHGYPASIVSWGSAHARSDPAAGLLKVEATGAYNSILGQPVSWEVCWEGACGPWSEPLLPGGNARAYSRSVWAVVSDQLPTGTPVDLFLTLSLSGSFGGDPDTEGVAHAEIRTWLNKPDTLMALTGGVDPLDDASYGSGIINWWRDVGAAPNLEILASNQVLGAFEKTVYSNVPESGGGGLPIFRPPLPEVFVGDILVLETELVAAVSLHNDGLSALPYDRAAADFFDTGTVGITLTTPGVQLAPVPEPAAVWMMLTGLVLLVPAYLGRRRRTAPNALSGPVSGTRPADPLGQARRLTTISRR